MSAARDLPSDGARTQRQLQGERSRRDLLAVARRLLAERGYAGMSVSALSDEASLSTSSIYWHFGSKDGVLAAVVEDGLEAFFASRVPADQYEGDPLERLEQMLMASAEQLELEPENLRLLLILTLERHEGHERSLGVVHQMREASRKNWEAALRPVFERNGGAGDDELIRALALLGRCVSDGAFIASIDEETSMSHVYLTFMRLVEALAASQRD